MPVGTDKKMSLAAFLFIRRQKSKKSKQKEHENLVCLFQRALRDKGEDKLTAKGRQPEKMTSKST